MSLLGDQMFKTARMQKFRAVFPRRVHDGVIARLHEAGVVQLKEISELEVARKAISEEIQEVSSILAKFREMGEFLGPPAGKAVVVKELSFGQTFKLAKKSLQRVGPKVTRLKEKVDELERERQDLLAQLNVLEKFREIKFPLRYLRSTDEIKITVGSIIEEQVGEFLSAVEEALAGLALTSTIGAGKRRVVIVACRARDQQKLSPIFYRFEVELLEIPPFSGPPSVVVRDLKARLAKNERQRQSFERLVGRLARANSKEVHQVRELLEIQRERIECAGLFGYTDATTVIEGWVRAKQAPELEKVFDVATRGHCILRAYDPQQREVENVPIQLENPNVVKDFEFVTEMYGLARYDEVDPTPFLSLTFPLFFAIALSDAGYGLALGLFMGSGFWLAKMFSPKLRRMMIVSAIFTIVAGLMIGGWFGLGNPMWVNPIQRPVPLLKLVIFVGIIHLLIAFGLAGALKDIFRRDWKSLVLNRLSPVLIIIGFFGLSFSALGIGLHEFGINYSFPKMDLFSVFNPLAPAGVVVTVSRVFFYIGLIIGVASTALIVEEKKGKIGRSLNVLYSITGHIADVSSYTRLMALGIATGVIAFSINLILGLVYKGMMPAEITPLSAILAIFLLIGLAFVFIAAHSFNIFISSLGCFIHTMRLHFAEFFGKFYESGGEKFAPFKAKRRFTKVEGGEWPGR